MRRSALYSKSALCLNLSGATAQLSTVKLAYKQELSAVKEVFSSLKERQNALVNHADHSDDALEAACAKIEDLNEAQDQDRVNLYDIIEEMQENLYHGGFSSSGPSLEQLFTTNGRTTFYNPNS